MNADERTQPHRPTLLANRYELEAKLGEGSMGEVFRAYDRLTNQRVAVKRVTAKTENLVFQDKSGADNLKLRLAQEFRTLASLRHPNIISVLDYGFDELGQPFVSMELLDAAQNVKQYAYPLPVQRQVETLIQVLQALNYLHRRGILHRDLKPDNILIGQEGIVKVLDFGLALEPRKLQTSASAESDGEKIVVGTLAYMAPELLNGGSGQVQTDLYAVGIIAYEVLKGKHPYNVENIAELINGILLGEPDYQGIMPPLELILRHLLAKQPQDRYDDSITVIEDLCEAVNIPFPAETEALREGFLQSARFVGRELELEQLMRAYHEMHTTRKGAVWVIGGESGIGKSRLLDELRITALVKGAAVLRGQTVEAGAAPYQVWRSVLRALIFQLTLTDFEAGVLKMVIPDIDTLIDRQVGDVPLLEPQAAQERLLLTVEALFSRVKQSTVVILEDLHWAGSESLALLKHLAQRISQLAVLFVGSYRLEERANLIKDIPNAIDLRLKRLNDNHIAELSASILGTDLQGNEVVELLKRESEGNVLFIVEVIRELAKDAGKLKNIGVVTLPERVISGGIQNIIANRLARLPAECHPLLQKAAVLGRELNLNILQMFMPMSMLMTWCQYCTEAAILEVNEDKWRFTHDKLRDAVLAELDKPQLQATYREVAEATEVCYGQDPAYYAYLAHLWGEAQVAEQQARYTIRAGEQALNNSAYPEAIDLLLTGLSLAERLNYPKTEKAHVTRLLAEAYSLIGKPTEVNKYGVMTLELLNLKHPTTSIAQGVAFARTVITQLRHRFERDTLKLRRKPLITGMHSIDAIRTCGLLSESYFYVDEAILSSYYSVLGVNLAERGGQAAEGKLVHYYGNMSITAGIVGLHGLARQYMRMVEELVEHTQYYEDAVKGCIAIGVYLLGVGEWALCEQFLQRITRNIERTNNLRQRDEMMSYRADIARFTANWRQSIQIYEELQASALRRGDRQMESWAISGRGENLLRLGLLDEALPPLQASLPMLMEIGENSNVIRVQGLLIQAYLRLGNFEAAAQIVKELQPSIEMTAPIAFWILEGYSGVVQYYLTLWEQNPQDAALVEQAAKMCQRLMKFGKVFMLGAPIAWAYECWLQHLKRVAVPAQKAFQKSLDLAKKQRMPYEEGIAYWLYARFLPANHPQRLTYLQQAQAIFERLEARWELNAVNQLLV